MTDTQSTVDYAMNASSMDRAVHEAVLEQLRVIRVRGNVGAHRSMIHDDITAVTNSVKRRFPRVIFSTETVNLIRDALISGKVADEDVSMPSGEVAYGIVHVDPATGATYISRSWFESATERDEFFSNEMNSPFVGSPRENWTQVPIRKITEYERG